MNFSISFVYVIIFSIPSRIPLASKSLIYFEETIDREIKSAIGTSATELNSLKTKLNNDIAQATNDLIAIEYLKRQYQEKLEK